MWKEGNKKRFFPVGTGSKNWSLGRPHYRVWGYGIFEEKIVGLRDTEGKIIGIRDILKRNMGIFNVKFGDTRLHN